MPTFDGTLTIPGEVGPPVPMHAHVTDGRLVLEVDGVEVGAWPTSGVATAANGGGILLTLGTDRVMIDVRDRTAFVTALSPPKGVKTRRVRRRPPPVLTGLGVAALAVVAAAVFFPQVVGSLALLLGLILLVTGSLTHSEPRFAVRLPVGFQPFHFVVAGFVVITVGMALVLLG